MFDVVALNDVVIKRFDLHVRNAGSTFDVEIYTKPGTFEGSDKDGSAWIQIQKATGIESQGLRTLTPLPPVQWPVMIQGASQYTLLKYCHPLTITLAYLLFQLVNDKHSTSF